MSLLRYNLSRLALEAQPRMSLVERIWRRQKALMGSRNRDVAQDRQRVDVEVDHRDVRAIVVVEVPDRHALRVEVRGERLEQTGGVGAALVQEHRGRIVAAV